MQIQAEKIWLFETDVTNPYFFGVKDGVEAFMSSNRVIELLNIETVIFFIDVIGKSGIDYTMRYGGEDTDISEEYGNSTSKFNLSFNMPTNRQDKIETLIGKQFSIVGMRRDLSFFCIFGQFTAEPFSIDNEVIKRVTFSSGNTNARIFDVNSVSITNILNVIDDDTAAPIEGGFDYGFDLILE